MKTLKNYFSRWEIALWCASVSIIVVSFIIFDKENYLTLIASLIGITSLIFCAKGNPFGQVLMIIFSLIYGFISYTFSYFGEMATYLGMSLPMAVFSLVSWLKNPYGDNESEVAVNRIKAKEVGFMLLLTCVVTVIFYFILAYLGTANLLPSTISVATSFVAVYLCARRSPYFAIAYAANDVVLIVLWVLAAIQDISYLSVIVCFLVFLVNDIYSFINWLRMQKRQES